jgi:hypothetical protein
VGRGVVALWRTVRGWPRGVMLPDLAGSCLSASEQAGPGRAVKGWTMEPIEKPDGPSSPLPNRVTVVDFDMPFGSMIVFMLKWALASVPALIILIVIGVVSFAILSGLIYGLASTAASLPRQTTSPEVSAAPSVPVLVVTVRPTATGWQLTNDTSLAWQNCLFSIAGHSVDIPILPSNSPHEFARPEFSGGGLPEGLTVTQSAVTVSCKVPESQKARVYFLQ